MEIVTVLASWLISTSSLGAGNLKISTLIGRKEDKKGVSIRFAFGEFRLLHRRAEVLDNEIEGGYHEVVPTRLN